MRMKIYYTGLFLMLFSGMIVAQDNPGTKILDNMLASIDRVHAIQFRLKQYERYNGKIELEDDRVKLKTNPLSLFIEVISPDAGAEVLWVQGENNGEAYVHPNGFPYLTLNFLPDSKTLRKGHHNIFALQLSYMAGLIRSTMQNAGSSFNSNLHLEQDVVFNHETCYQLNIEHPSFAFVPYTIKPGENLISLAERLHLSEYMILENNPGLSEYSDVKAGQVIHIPNNYARKMTLYISKKTYLPLAEFIYDDKGLFERYEFSEVKVNPEFGPEEFSKHNPAYHF